ncbi:MAG: hypothetical protein WDO73_20270 [Ignavibacteriota bacterium]
MQLPAVCDHGAMELLSPPTAGKGSRPGRNQPDDTASPPQCFPPGQRAGMIANRPVALLADGGQGGAVGLESRAENLQILRRVAA